MRILFSNDGVGDAGGVQSYLAAVVAALAGRRHDVALLHLDPLRDAAASPAGTAEHFCVGTSGRSAAIDAAMRWHPTVCFSHNMRALSVERALIARMPVVKMMHGYFGTCVGGQKIHAFPRVTVCHRRFGLACAAIYLPRHCGQWSIGKLAEQYSWARAQRMLFAHYAEIVVASRHMSEEYARHGVERARLTTNPLFSSTLPSRMADPPPAFNVLFLGRMTNLKGGDLLLRAAARVRGIGGAGLTLTFAGDGPSRPAWEHLSESLGVHATFTGWVEGRAREALFRQASIVAVPSVWPEPFGLVGLEAGAYGVPAVAFDVGGVSEWLRDGINGWMVPAEGGERALGDALASIQRQAATLGSMRAGARRVAEELSLDRHVAILEDVLSRAAQRGVAV
jgi:glycosyltransferase involved in cell wall biosynthesis